MTRPLVVLIGPPAAGKTRIGKAVSKLLGAPFADTDKRVVAQHGPIPAIFAQHGEAVFRRWEREAVEAALGERAVVALGGGAVLDPETRRDLDSQRVALVTVTAEAIAARLTGSQRPLLAGGVEAWTRLAEERRPLYEALASRTWDTSRRPVGAIVREIADWVRHEEGSMT